MNMLTNTNERKGNLNILSLLTLKNGTKNK